MKAIKIPHTHDTPIEIIEVDFATGSDNYQVLAAAIGGPCKYIERVRCTLSVDHGLVLVVDEEGQLNEQEANFRAWPLYPVPGYPLAGDVLVMAENRTPLGVDFVDMEDPEKALLLVLGATA